MYGAYRATEERLLTTPDLDDIPEDESAEPLDADVQHLATNEEVDELLELEEATAPDPTTDKEDDA